MDGTVLMMMLVGFFLQNEQLLSYILYTKKKGYEHFSLDSQWRWKQLFLIVWKDFSEANQDNHSLQTYMWFFIFWYELCLIFPEK